MEDLDILEEWRSGKAVEVEQGEWDAAEAPEKLVTTGLGPCAGVLVHNPKERKAAMGHFVEPRMKLEGFVDLVRHARSEMGDILDQVVYLAGTSPEDRSKEAQGDCEEIRRYVVKVFIENGYASSQLRKNWNGPDESASLAVDTESGKVLHIKNDYGALLR